MVWRAFTFLVIAFWLVMTLLLVRATYYPEGSQFTRVPPGKIFKIFLERGATENTLQIYHGDKKAGYVNFSPRRTGKAKTNGDYDMLLSGSMDRGSVDFVDSRVEWHLNVTLHGAERWGGMSGTVRFPDAGSIVSFAWPENASLPKFTVHTKTGDVDDTMLKMMAPQLFGASGVTPPPGVNLPEGGAEGALQIKAREGVMALAGQRRRGYVMEFTIMDQYRAKAFFTEAGELALVEMPDGWRALHQIIYQLVPEIPEPDEP
jgi:hypothetical protein